VLTEHPNHYSLGVHAHDVTVAAHPGVSVGFDPAEDGSNRVLMGFDHLPPHLFVAEAEKDRHRFGSRERGVISAYRFLPVPASEVTARDRVLSRHHRQECVGVDLTLETEAISSSTPPSSGRLVIIEVVGR
jgi:hypothetical protein